MTQLPVSEPVSGPTEALVEDPADQPIDRFGFWVHFKALVRSSLMFKIGLLIVFVSFLLAVFGEQLARYPLEDSTGARNLAPSAAHWFGTDASGFDIFSRCLAAPRIDVSIALFASSLSLVVGTSVGLLVSFFRGWLGELVMRLSDAIQAFPLFVLAVIYVTMAGRNRFNIVVIIAVLNIPIYLRLVRSQVLSLRERTFVEAARANGDTPLSIAVRHVLPNALAPALAQATVTMGWAILITAGLSFIGAGIQPPTPEWGAMIAAGSNGIIIGQWWPSIFPGVMISLTVFGFALVGDGLQRILLRRR